MQNIFVLFVPGYSAFTICFSLTFICRDLQLAKDSHGGEADCKERQLLKGYKTILY